MNMEMHSRQVQKATLEAVVIRADGRREDLGVISYWHRNPFMRLWYRWVRGIKGRFHPPSGER